MALPLLPFLLIGGAAVAVAVAAGRGSRYALSSDCQENKLSTMGPDDVQAWVKDHLAPAIGKAAAGDGVISLRPIEGQAIPEFVIKDIADCQAELQAEGMSEAEARKLCRVEGTTAHFPADPENPDEIGLYLYQQVADPACTALRVTWLEGDDGTTSMEIVWPTPAAECLYRMLAIASKMELLATTLDQRYAITPEDLAGVAEVCPQSRAAWGGEGPRPGGGATRFAGVSVGADGLNFAQMAHDANAGMLHPAHILTGAVFR